MLTDADVAWLAIHCPFLAVNASRTEVSGVIKFSAVYNPSQEEFRWLIVPDNGAEGEVLDSEYRISIKDSGSQRKLPYLTIDSPIMEKHIDRHFYVNQNACLCGVIEEQDFIKNEYSFLLYFEKFVIQFLYAQTYYDKHGNWPWQAYAHGSAGVLRSFASNEPTIENTAISLVLLKADVMHWERLKAFLTGTKIIETDYCFCTTPGQIRECHRSVLFDIIKLKQLVQKYKISL